LHRGDVHPGGAQPVEQGLAEGVAGDPGAEGGPAAQAAQGHRGVEGPAAERRSERRERSRPLRDQIDQGLTGYDDHEEFLSRTYERVLKDRQARPRCHLPAHPLISARYRPDVRPPTLERPCLADPPRAAEPSCEASPSPPWPDSASPPAPAARASPPCRPDRSSWAPRRRSPGAVRSCTGTTTWWSAGARTAHSRRTAPSAPTRGAPSASSRAPG